MIAPTLPLRDYNLYLSTNPTKCTQLSSHRNVGALAGPIKQSQPVEQEFKYLSHFSYTYIGLPFEYAQFIHTNIPYNTMLL